MRRTALAILSAMLICAITAFGSSGLTRLNGQWQGNGNLTLKAQEIKPGSDFEREMTAAMFSALGMVFDATGKKITLTLEGKGDPVAFTVVSDSKDKVTIKAANGDEMVLEITDDKTAILRADGGKDKPIVLNKVK